MRWATEEHTETFCRCVFFSFASVVRHFPSFASNFSHSSFEISTWGLATGWSALRFCVHHHAGFSRETFDIFLFFWAWVYCPHWLASAFILSQYFMVVMYGLSLSTVLCPQGSTLSCLFCGFWFWLCCFPAVIIAVWITVPQSMDHFSSLLPVSLFLCSDIVSDIVFNSVEFFSLFYFLVVDSSLSL